MNASITRKALLEPFQRFFQQETAGGIVLLLTALIAIILANSPWQEAYQALWHYHLTIGVENFSLSMPLHAWINDGLMAIFFFLVGLEIKRELLVGELARPQQACLPILAAVGGMAVPGLLYILLNPPGTPFSKGWGIPTVTDIAFSLGVLALLGKRVPLYLKVFLAALAIADDLGAILIIALFYSGNLHWEFLLPIGLILAALAILNRWNVRWLPLYAFLGALLWFSMLKSGIHTTIAGVLLALCIPASSNIKPERFYDDGMTVLGTLRQVGGTSRYAILEEDDYQAGVHKIATLCEEAQSPLQRLEHGLHPWVTFGIMPVFALANAGVSFSTGSFTQSLSHPVSLGIIVGMVLGKQSGIFLFSWLTVRLGLSKLPDGIQWRHMLGLACLGGIGFTMSLFIAELAFQGNILTTAKIGILAGSIASGVLGGGILLSVLRQNPQPVANISTPD